MRNFEEENVIEIDKEIEKTHISSSQPRTSPSTQHNAKKTGKEVSEVGNSKTILLPSTGKKFSFGTVSNFAYKLSIHQVQITKPEEVLVKREPGICSYQSRTHDEKQKLSQRTIQTISLSRPGCVGMKIFCPYSFYIKAIECVRFSFNACVYSDEIQNKMIRATRPFLLESALNASFIRQNIIR